MKRLFAAFLLIASFSAHAADWSVSTTAPQYGDSQIMLTVRQAKALSELYESFAGFGTNLLQVTGSLSASFSPTNQIAIYTADGTNLYVNVGSITNAVNVNWDPTNQTAIYTIDGTNLGVNVGMITNDVTINMNPTNRISIYTEDGTNLAVNVGTITNDVTVNINPTNRLSIYTEDSINLSVNVGTVTNDVTVNMNPTNRLAIYTEDLTNLLVVATTRTDKQVLTTTTTGAYAVGDNWVTNHITCTNILSVDGGRATLAGFQIINVDDSAPALQVLLMANAIDQTVDANAALNLSSNNVNLVRHAINITSGDWFDLGTNRIYSSANINAVYKNAASDKNCYFVIKANDTTQITNQPTLITQWILDR